VLVSNAFWDEAKSIPGALNSASASTRSGESVKSPNDDGVEFAQLSDHLA
jgi:hypothetical protein